MILGNTINQLLKARSIVQKSKCWFAEKGKNSLQIPTSTCIVEPLYFQKRSPTAKVLNWIKTNNTFKDCSNAFSGFKKDSFEQKYLIQYNSFIEKYNKRHIIGIQNYLCEELFKQYKAQYKFKPKQLPFGPLKVATSVKVVQARVNSNNISPLRSVDRWYQFTCKFQSQGEQSYYHIIQRHYKAKNFLIIKLFIA